MSLTNRLSAALLISVAGFCQTTLAAPPPAAPSTSVWCASGKTVNFADLNWESGAFLTSLTRYILEHGYGCKTDALPGSSVAMEVALSKNDIQVFAEEWIGRSSAWRDAVKANKVIGIGHIIVGATEGWYVPEYVIKGDAKRGIKALAPDLKSVTDLPRYKDVFKDEEEPSKGRFLNCPSGWTCQGVNSQKLKAYGLLDTYVNFRPGTGPALDGAIASAVQRGKPILFYYWNPTALMGINKFIRLDEPVYGEKCWATLIDPSNNKPCGASFPPNEIELGVSRVFHDADPVLVQMLSKVNVPLVTLNQLLADRAEKKLDSNTLVLNFLKHNPTVWQAWMPADVASKVTASLKE